MKKNFIFFFALSTLVTIFILSCTKNGGSNSSTSSGCKLTKWVEGLNTATDTTFTIIYDNNNRVAKIANQYGGSPQDTTIATYDANGKLSLLTKTYSGATIRTVSYTYNNNGLLSNFTASQPYAESSTSSITYDNNNRPNAIITYNGSTWYATDSLQFDANGDLISLKALKSSETKQVNITYNTSFTNNLKSFSLMDIYGDIEMQDLAQTTDNEVEFYARYFSTHLMSKCSISDGSSADYTYTQDATGNLTKSTAAILVASPYGNANYTFTRNFSYNCN